jgi:hypothetical protein
VGEKLPLHSGPLDETLTAFVIENGRLNGLMWCDCPLIQLT